ncbi:MAG TPA: PEP-CTERM sorting domain-containing protein [Bryobacteraceae bacterium]|nr:PEP-CTERM sorting domain-containing protein [Bryobacteraceae bacterium]
MRCTVIGLGLLAIAPGWANFSQCNPNPPGTTVTYNLGNSPSAGSDALSAGGSSAAGCEQIDNQFTNFSYTGTTPVGAAVSTQFSGASEAVQDIDFTSNQFSFTSAGAPNFTSVDFKFVVTLNPADIPPAPDSFWSITGLNLAIAGGTLGNANEQVNIDISFCAGATVCTDSSHGVDDGRLFYSLRSPTPISQACFDAADGSTSCSSPTQGSSSSFGTSLGDLGAQSIAFDVVVEYIGEPGVPESISGLDLTFNQSALTPEPSTFIPLAAGLAMVALGSRRREKATRKRMLSLSE